MFSKTTIIFVHGLGLSGEVWAPQRNWCRKNIIDFVTLTLPGHGDRRNEDVSIDKMVDEIVSIANKSREVILVGHSFGAFLCALAAPQLKNIKSILLINPLFKSKQLPIMFLVSIKFMKVFQQIFGIAKPGNYLKGGKWFWKWGIYPYSLFHNPAIIIEKIYYQIKKREKDYFPRFRFNVVRVLSQDDELVRPLVYKDDIVVSTRGHMLFRLNSKLMNSFLDQVAL